MKNKSAWRRASSATAAVVCGLALCGCSAFRAKVTPMDVDKGRPLTADYDYADLRWLGRTVGQEMIKSDFLRKAETPPIMVVMGIQNRTEQHIDTKAITDTIRTEVIQSGRAQFVNEARRDALLKEQGYQLAHCPPEARVTAGRQLGARYMLTGSLVEISKESPREVRLSKRQDVYYQLTAEVTDLESGLIAWTTQLERLRSARRPLIGW